MQEDSVILEFTSPDALGVWETVADTVMGGISESGLSATADGTAIFQGVVSLENQGGFASVRTKAGEYDLSGYGGVVVRVRGDGKRYRLRFRTDGAFEGVAYQATFVTRPGEWVETRLPLAVFQPVFRGRRVEGAPPLDAAHIKRIGFMIADHQPGPFRLEIAWVRAYRP